MGPTTQLAGFLPRVSADGLVRGLADQPGARATFASNWGGVRATQLHLDPQEVSEGYLLNNLVALNLGPETTCESNFQGRGWVTCRTPHHGVTVFPAGLPYASRAREGGDYLLVELMTEFVSKILGARPEDNALPTLLGARDRFAEHVLLALAEEGRRDSQSTARAESLGAALVTHLAEHRAKAELAAAPPSLPSLPSHTLDNVLEFVARNLDTPLSLERLASVAGMDLFRFARAFKQSTGSSPHRYVMEARIMRAKELLRDRTISITEIAYRTGFASPSHFSVTFRRVTNIAPRAFRGGPDQEEPR
jgi:AraC family transcriptional regulator